MSFLKKAKEQGDTHELTDATFLGLPCKIARLSYGARAELLADMDAEDQSKAARFQLELIVACLRDADGGEGIPDEPESFAWLEEQPAGEVDALARTIMEVNGLVSDEEDEGNV